MKWVSCMSYEIKKVKSTELQLLKELGIKTFLDTFEDSYSDEDFQDYFDSAFTIEKLAEELEDSNSETYFYEVDSNIVGYFKLNIGESQTEPMGEQYLELQRIYFLKEAQGGGKGANIINYAEERAKALNKTHIWLGVWKHNEQALKFYNKHGFQVTGEHRFVTGDTVDLDLVMEKSVVH